MGGILQVQHGQAWFAHFSKRYFFRAFINILKKKMKKSRQNIMTSVINSPWCSFKKSLAQHKKKVSMDTKHARMCICKKCIKLTNFLIYFLTYVISIIVMPDLSITLLIFVEGIFFWGKKCLCVHFTKCSGYIDTAGSSLTTQFILKFHLGVLSLSRSLWRVLMSEMLSLDLLCSPYSIPSPRRCDPISFFNANHTENIPDQLWEKLANLLVSTEKIFAFLDRIYWIFFSQFNFRERTNPLCVHSHRLHYIAVLSL